MNKAAIVKETQLAFNAMSKIGSEMEAATFFFKPLNKWSVAEQVQHLILSTNKTAMAYRLPLFIVKLVGGKPMPTPADFNELQKRYTEKIEEGAKASKPYIPKNAATQCSQEKLIEIWQRDSTKYLTALQKCRTEKSLDQYAIKHPLLGKISLRELCYFTIFHTQHHIQSIQQITATTV